MIIIVFFYWPSGSGQPLAPTCSYTAYTLSVIGLAYFLLLHWVVTSCGGFSLYTLVGQGFRFLGEWRSSWLAEVAQAPAPPALRGGVRLSSSSEKDLI